MFDAIRSTSSSHRSRFGAGTVISVAVHVGLGALVVVLTTHPPVPKKVEPRIDFPPPAPVKKQLPGPTAKATPAEQPKQRPVAKRDRILPPKVIPTELPPPVEAQPDPGPQVSDPTGETGGGGGGGPGGPDVENGRPDGTGSDEKGGEDTVSDYIGGMTRPAFDRNEVFRNVYTREALEAGVQGVMIVKCAVLADGLVRNCRPIKSLPFLTDTVIERLEHSRMAPATFHGAPVSVNYVFNFNFSIPR